MKRMAEPKPHRAASRTVVLAVAAAVYLMAAWLVAPGFYDGIAPQQPYNFVCPPAIAGANSGVKPASGHLVINVVDGVSDANSAFTDDGQIIIGFLPGAFDVTGKTQVTVDIMPVSPCPIAPGLHFATNAYLIKADAPLTKPGNLVLRYSDLVPAPSNVYMAADVAGLWKSIGASAVSQAFTIQTTTSQLGYFAAGYPANAVTQSPTATSQLLPIAVAVLILGVLVAGIPLAIVRRRRAGEVEEPDREVDA
jgi:hypothetical protein